MKRELRFGVATLQNAPWNTLVERWQCLDEFGLTAPGSRITSSTPFSRANPFWKDGRFCRRSPRILGGYASGRW